jgi:DNA-binding transcriptional LysR family regulator
MEKFTIDPQDCLVLKAFNDSTTLREAAALLKCDPAGLARRAQAISLNGFLQKVDNRWRVTQRGLNLIAWVETSIQSQNHLLTASENLRMASTTWFAEELIIPHLPQLVEMFDDPPSLSISVPQKSFENAILDGSVDYVVACHPPERPEIAHKQICAEKWVIITPKSWHLKGRLSYEDLKNKPLVRHSEMNLDLVLPQVAEFTESNVTIDHLIGVRAAVRKDLGWSVVPRILISSSGYQNTIHIHSEISIPDRKVCLWWLRHRTDIKRQSTKLSSWLKEACENVIPSH